MIKVTINGKTKKFDPGMTVYDIIDEFDSQYTHATCAVKVGEKRLSLDDVIDYDCEMELLTFRDLAVRKPVDELHDDESVQSSENEDVLSQDEIAEYTMQTIKQMFGVDNDVLSSAEMAEDGADPFDNIATLMDSLDDVSEEEEPMEQSETTETAVDDLFDGNDPVFDGEFVSVTADAADENFTGEQDHSVDELEEMTPSEEQTAPSYDFTQIKNLQNKTDEMQMHLGVPKIDDLVAELLVDMESKENGNASESSAEDYSVDDGDMDAFLASQILPEGVVSDHPGDDTAMQQASPEWQPLPESWYYANYDVDEDSIEDFVDYGRNNSAEEMLYSDSDDDEPWRRKPGMPRWAKAAVLVVVLLGVGWLVSRIAIQAAGSPSVIRRNGGRTSVSVSDVSDSDEVSSVPSEKQPEYDKKQLVPGKSNALVQAVQKRLCALGYLDQEDADGSYNKAMEKAIDAFRKENGVKAKGNIDKKTFEKLFDKQAKTASSTVTTTTEATTTTTDSTASTTRNITAPTKAATTTTTARRTTRATTAATTTTTARKTKRTTKKTTKKTVSEVVSTSTEVSQSNSTTTEPTTAASASTTKSTTDTTTKSTTASTTMETISTTKSTTHPTSASHPDVPFEFDPSEVKG